MKEEKSLFCGVRLFVAFIALLMLLGCAHTCDSEDYSIDDMRQITYIFKPRPTVMSEGLFCLFLQLEEYSKSLSFFENCDPAQDPAQEEWRWSLYIHEPSKNNALSLKRIFATPSKEKGVSPPFFTWLIGKRHDISFQDYNFILTICELHKRFLDNEVLSGDIVAASDYARFPTIVREEYLEKKNPGLRDDDEWYLFTFYSTDYILLFNKNHMVVFLLYPLWRSCYDVLLLDNEAMIDTTMNVKGLIRILSKIVEEYEER